VEVPDQSAGLPIAPLILLEQPELTHPDKALSQLCVWRSGDIKLPVFKRLALLVGLDCRMRGKPRHQNDTGSYAPMSFMEACEDLEAAVLQHKQAGKPARPAAATTKRKEKGVSLSAIQKYLGCSVKVPSGGTVKVGWTPAAYTKVVPEFYSLRRTDCVMSSALGSGDVTVLS
jgi:hypothetical protein